MTGSLQSGLYKLVVSWRLPENNRKGSQLFSNMQEKSVLSATYLKNVCYINETRKKWMPV